MVEFFKKNQLITLLCIIGVVYFFLQYITPLIAPVLVAMLFVTILGPLLKKMQRFHLNRQVGAVLLLVVFGLVLLLLLWMFLTWLAGSLPEWIVSLQGMWKSLEKIVGQICNLGSRMLNMDNVYLEEIVLGFMQEGVINLEENVLPNVLTGSVKYVKEILAVGGFLLLFVIASVFLAKDYDTIMNRLLDRQECHILLEIICGIIRYIATFVKAQLVIMAIIGASAAITLAISGISSGVFWGLLAGALDALPFLGTGIVLVPMALLQLLEENYIGTLVCILLYVGCIFIREFLEPRLIGNKMGIPPLIVLTAIYAGLKLFGIVGIIKGPLGFVMVHQTYFSLRKAGWWEKSRIVEGQSS